MKKLETSASFEQRKADHIQISLNAGSQALPAGSSYFDFISLVPEALPEMNLDEVDLSVTVVGRKFPVPFFISSMTAGHAGSVSINEALTRLSERHQILMGVGSQRKELFDPKAASEWSALRSQFPLARWAGNIGISQAIETSDEQLRTLQKNLNAEMFFIHLNPLQEALQKEGTPQFRGGLKAIEKVVKALSVPVVIKEVGCGIAAPTLEKLRNLGVAAVDVSGSGGTHWGQIETLRHSPQSLEYSVGQTFNGWGLPTIECLLQAQALSLDYEIWASGGVRSGLDVAKLIALGAKFIGIAQPWLAASLSDRELSDSNLEQLFQKVKTELEIALFITGCKTPDELRRRQAWAWNKYLKGSPNSALDNV